MAYRSLRRQMLHYWSRPHEGIRREPLEIPAAWRGEELRRREDWDDPQQRRHLLRLWLSLDESRPLRLRLMTAHAYLGLLGTMVREPIREKLTA